jgi:hypothetical protein
METNDLLDPTVNQSNNNFGNGQVPNATAVLVLGIISIVGCIFYGIPGLICGIIAIVLHKKDKAVYLTNPAMYETSFKNSKAGNVCAIIGLSLSILFIVILIFYIFAIFTAFSMLGR